MNVTKTCKEFEAKTKKAESDRQSELKAFDDSKAGVKGLVDAGIKRSQAFSFSFPIIDVKGINDVASRSEIIGKVKTASEEWGFFQIINHEMPVSVMNEMIERVREFNEQDAEVKKKYYTRDPSRRFQFKSNFNLYTAPAAAWRDSVTCVMAPNPPDPQEFPDVLRDITFEYSKYVMKVGHTVYELLSEALGLNPSYLKDIGCAETMLLASHYHPPCPEPELTFGNRTHVDIGLLTILLQDQTGGFQLITNDKFKGVLHRALVFKEVPRISVAAFLKPHSKDIGDNARVYGPIKGLITEEEPPLYRDTTYKEYETFYLSKSGDGKPKLPYFRLS
ncbi:hypothetical protein DH2020_037608 [Rehmannia glutinosa]|uniref:1-aminocyclopropane-1-carboxylate oxidase-like protein n=1 Tax=Rehmannia glutinosa TaxID=99300 RepID=A0ABR0V3N4_REHGL